MNNGSEDDDLIPLLQPVWVSEEHCRVPRVDNHGVSTVGVELEAVLKAATDEQLMAAAQWLVGAGFMP
jgi:hypothetical protein